MDAVLEMTNGSDRNALKRRSRGDKSFLVGMALVLFVGGFLSPAIGLILIILHSAIRNDIDLGRAGTVFMVASIPMLLLGSHLTDLLEKNK